MPSKSLIISIVGVAIIVTTALFFLKDGVLRTGKSTEDRARQSAGSEVDSREKLEALAYLGFVPDDPDPEKRGVSFHDPARSSKGINLYIPSGYRANLIDMEGDVLHTWTAPEEYANGWIMPELSENGDLFVIDGVGGGAERVLLKLDWDSRPQWISTFQHHHDISLAENGDIYTPTKARREITHQSRTLPLLDNSITILTPDGKIKKHISLYDLMGSILNENLLDEAVAKLAGWERTDAEKYAAIVKDGFDLFHTNTIELLPGDIGVANKGDLLICMRYRNLIAIIDAETEKVLWLWGPGEVDWPHHPSVLSNGNIMIFDNGAHREYSRLIEVDPNTRKIVWEYKADPPETFYTEGRGAAQELPNGNILITESGKGHVFEITRDGAVVWEFWNPQFNDDGKRVAIYRMIRFPAEMPAMMPSDDNFQKRLKSHE